MDDYRETTPENAPGRPYAGPLPPTRVEGLWHACRAQALWHASEALLAAREAVDALPEATDRTYALDQIAHRWLELADRLEPQGAEKGQEGGVEGRAPGSGYPGVGQAVPEPQADAQGSVDHPAYAGVEYPVGSRWRDKDGDLWSVVSVSSNGMPLLLESPLAEDTSVHTLRSVLEHYAPLTRV